jgi:hypothetical protein
MRIVTSLCALGALGVLLIAGAGCGHYYHDHYDDRPVYRDHVYYHDDYRGPHERHWDGHHHRDYGRYDRRYDRDCW